MKERSLEARLNNFLTRAKDIHGDKYSYKKVNFVNVRTPITITCSTHGDFEQLPSVHLGKGGAGCPKCANSLNGNNSRLDPNEFINRIHKLFGNTYDYTFCKYVKSDEKVKIICNTHGEFSILPHKLLSGNGCPNCANLSRSNKLSISFDEFVAKAVNKHGDKFLYSKISYKSMSVGKIDITCKKHNEVFSQLPIIHLRSKSGCPSCKKESVSKSKIGSLDSFIEKASSVHNNYYCYDKSEYINTSSKILITCPVHGDFKQIVRDHLRGSGCSKCILSGKSGYNLKYAEEHKEELLKNVAYIYLLKLRNNIDTFFKIGISIEPETRIQNIINSSGLYVLERHIEKTNMYNAILIEQSFIKENKKSRYVTSSKFPGYTELFNEDIYLKALNSIK
jgi:hypothetical protein